MKRSKKILALATVFVLILSLSTTAYAADAYTYSVIPNAVYYEAEDVSLAQLNHEAGDTTVLRYSYEARTHSFDQSQFNSNYLSGLMRAYSDAGLWSTLTIPAKSSTISVPATEPDGLYGVLLFTYTVDGTWNVKIGNTVTSAGTFRNAPYTYSVAFFAFELYGETE